MKNCFVFFEKLENKIRVYGSIKELFENENKHIKIEKGSFYNKISKNGSINLDSEDYEDANCRIAKRVIVRSKQKKSL